MLHIVEAIMLRETPGIQSGSLKDRLKKLA
jgi:hypothetical protein